MSERAPSPGQRELSTEPRGTGFRVVDRERSFGTVDVSFFTSPEGRTTVRATAPMNVIEEDGAMDILTQQGACKELSFEMANDAVQDPAALAERTAQFVLDISAETAQ